ncbi:hypothetical protein PBI_SCTP2_72 [Salicola phage SCTP-2]|nr:hypothetical protein PBI_SCTP2_72 [Salicola phage SCTP-2]
MMKYKLLSKQKGFISLGAIKSFFQFSNISVYLIIGTIALYGWYRINSLESENQELQSKNADLNVEVEETKKEYNDLVDDINEFRKQINQDIKKQQNITKELRETRIKNQKEISKLRQIFNQSSSGEQRDFENLARQKPDMIENRINDGTREFKKRLKSIFNQNKLKNQNSNKEENNND